MRGGGTKEDPYILGPCSKEYAVELMFKNKLQDCRARRKAAILRVSQIMRGEGQ